jgi:hypothetical protein
LIRVVQSTLMVYQNASSIDDAKAWPLFKRITKSPVVHVAAVVGGFGVWGLEATFFL